jgi:hypothetical protein
MSAPKTPGGRARGIVIGVCIATGSFAYFLVRGVGFSLGTLIWIVAVGVGFATLGFLLAREERGHI